MSHSQANNDLRESRVLQLVEHSHRVTVFPVRVLSRVHTRENRTSPIVAIISPRPNSCLSFNGDACFCVTGHFSPRPQCSTTMLRQSNLALFFQEVFLGLEKHIKQSEIYLH